MKTKKEIVENWLTRYTGRRLEEFTKYILLTNFDKYLDIFADQFGGEKGKKFMSKQVKELFVEISDLPPNEQKERLAATFEKWVGNLEQLDDVLVIGVRI